MREEKKMEFTLNSPLTEEDLDKIYDVDMDNTSAVTFHTKHGKDVEFVKPVMCKDCKHRHLDGMIWNCPFGLSGGEDFFCAYGAKDGEQND